MSGDGKQPMRSAMSSKFAAETVHPEVLRAWMRRRRSWRRLCKFFGKQGDEVGRLKNSGAKIEMEFQKRGWISKIVECFFVVIVQSNKNLRIWKRKR